MLRRETVEAAAPHEEEKVDQHIAFGAQLALVSGLTQDARARKAAPVAKAREGDFNELQAVQIRDQPPRILARLEPNRGRVGLFEKGVRSEEHTSELQSLMRISYAVFCLKKKTPQLTKDPQ